MPETLFPVERGEAYFMRRTLESAGNDAGVAANGSHAAEESAYLVARCTAFPAELKASYKTAADEVFGGRYERCNELGHALLELCAARLSVVEGVLRRLAEDGPEADALRRVRDELTRFRGELEMSWPFFTRDAIEEAREAERRGELLDVEEAFAEMAGVDLATWRQRVEAHKLKRREYGRE
jgi:hypothetical protein